MPQRQESGCPCESDFDALSEPQLFRKINEVSFAVYEALLYLDTHPDDPEALSYFRKYSKQRIEALREYARRFGPLTIDTAKDHDSCSFAWMQQPWPWELREGGIC